MEALDECPPLEVQRGYVVPVINGSIAPVFTYSVPGANSEPEIPHITVRGLASPSRGSKETCVWRMTVAPGAPKRMGTVTREEIFLVLSGRAAVTLDGEQLDLDPGDVLIAPPNTTFGIGNPHDESAEMVVVFPVGGRAVAPGMDPFVPPWAE